MSSGGPAPPPGSDLAANVEFLVAHTRDLESAERERTTSLHTTAASLVAISGVLLGLTAAFGKDLALIVGGARNVGRAADAAALGFLFVAVCMAAWSFLPPAFWTFSILEIRQYTTRGYLTREPLFVRGTTLSGLIAQIALTRSANARKEKLIRWAFASFLLGLFAVVTTAVTFLYSERRSTESRGARTPVVSPLPCTRRSSWRTTGPGSEEVIRWTGYDPIGGKVDDRGKEASRAGALCRSFVR